MNTLFLTAWLWAAAAAVNADPGPAPVQANEGPVYRDSCDVKRFIVESHDPDQGDVGSCHVFAAALLMRAALRRQYPTLSDSAVTLSEADLFVQSVLNNPNFFSKLMRKALKKPITAKDVSSFEGNSTYADLKLARENGVSLAFADPYWAFALAPVRGEQSFYDIYREKIAAAVNEAAGGWRTMGRHSAPCAGQRYAIDSPCMKEWMEKWIEKVGKDYAGEKTRASSKSDRRKSLLARGDNDLYELIHRQRRTIKSLLKDAQILDELVPEPEWILDQLDHGRPVYLSIDLARTGIPNLNLSGSHAVVIIGYHHAQDGARLYDVRNSWGIASTKAALIRALNWEQLEAAGQYLSAVAMPGDHPGNCSFDDSH